ncbi:hypothetical protein [Hyalangium gracile]|uniref:hypothetical protein n=1 Tax=Hyalangium gracile TaxID=394092 RepID=UPI001CC8EDEE|nr:hypothetical protein [Hyalangium gracile]
MNPKVEHPSYLELDRVGLGLASPASQEHVRRCGECSAYLERLVRTEPLPAWVQVLREPAPPARMRAPWWRLLPPLLATGALASALLWLLPARNPPEPAAPYVGVKGVPAATVFIKRGDQVREWDGARPVLPGDSLRLRVSASGYRHVWVGTRAPGSDWIPLYEGPLAEGETLLPASWRVNATGDAEVLTLLVSRDGLEGAALERALADAPQGAEAWLMELRLPKTPGP